MPRAMVVLGEGGWEARARRLARVLSPVAVSPAAPRETVAALDAWGLSLMPRSARVRGVAMGLGILGARATSGVAERLTRMLAPADAPLPARLAAWAVVGGAGAALAAVPERHCRKLWVASLQSTGLLLRDGAAGGVVHDVAAGCIVATPASGASGRSPAVPCTLPGCCTGRAGGRRHGGRPGTGIRCPSQWPWLRRW